MSETPSAPSSEMSSPPSSAAEQARIRKAKREAKIKAGGQNRLDKITGLGGSVKKELPTQPKVSDPTADPEEVDISEHFYTPTKNNQPQIPFSSPSAQISDDQLRAMMLGGLPPGQQGVPQQNPFAGFPGMEQMPGMEGMGGPPGADDPMIKMLQQMMGGPPGEGANGFPAFPGMPNLGMPGQAGAVVTEPYAYLWRIVHALFALSLGSYVAFTTTFSGTKLDRELSALDTNMAGLPSNFRFFWIFATVEVLLQSSRFFLEQKKAPPQGMMGMVVGFLPEPYKGILSAVMKYGRIWTTISADAMTCLFVLGITCWFRGNI